MHARPTGMGVATAALMLALIVAGLSTNRVHAAQPTTALVITTAAQENQLDTQDTAQGNQAVPAQGLQETQQGNQEGETGAEVVTYSREAVFLVVSILVLLGGLFYLLLSWSRRREMAGYYGEVYKETIENWEYRRLLAPYTEKLDRGEYHEEIVLEKSRPEPGEELIDLAEKLGKSYQLDRGSGLPGRTRRPGSGPSSMWDDPSQEGASVPGSTGGLEEAGQETRDKYDMFNNVSSG